MTRNEWMMLYRELRSAVRNMPPLSCSTREQATSVLIPHGYTWWSVRYERKYLGVTRLICKPACIVDRSISSRKAEEIGWCQYYKAEAKKRYWERAHYIAAAKECLVDAHALDRPFESTVFACS